MSGPCVYASQNLPLFVFNEKSVTQLYNFITAMLLYYKTPLRYVHLASQSFLTLNWPSICYNTHKTTCAWESNFRIEIFASISVGQKGEAGGASLSACHLDHRKYSRLFLYENPILHACPKCTFASGWPNILVLINLFSTIPGFLLNKNENKKRGNCISNIICRLNFTDLVYKIP